MELVHIAKALWRKKVWLALGFVLATLAATSMVYQLGPSPKSKTVRYGAGQTEILIDSPSSVIGDLKRDVPSLIARGGIFERFLATDEATKAIAKAAGLPANQIAVVAPKLFIDGVPDAKSAERASKLAGKRPYLIQVQQGDDLPVLSIVSQAPTPDEARKLANGSATALADVVERLQKDSGVPENRLLTIRQLGTASAGEIVENPSKLKAVAVFVVVFGFACFLILAGPAIADAWRTSEPRRSPSPAGANGSGPTPFIEPAPSLDEPGRVEAMYSAAGVPGKRGKKRSQRNGNGGAPADGEPLSTEAERLLGL
jgi:hypothetical protein